MIAPLHADWLQLDSNAFFALQIHGIQKLSLHGALFNGARELEHTVGQGAFAMVDVGDNTEISDEFLVHDLIIIP